MTLWQKFSKNWRRFAAFALALLLLSMFVTFLLQIVFRYILGWSVGWTIEWVAIAWLWGILFGYAFVVRERDEIRLDIVYSAVGKTTKRGFDIFAGLVVAAIFAYTLPSSIDYITFMAREKTAYMRWPFDLVFAVYIPFALMIIYRALRTAYRAFKGTEHHGFAPEEHDYD